MRDPARDVHTNWEATFRSLADGLAQGAVLERAPVLAAFAGLPIAFFNQVFVFRGGSGLEESLATTLGWARDRGVPFSVTVPQGAPSASSVQRLVTDAGMHEEEGVIPGMALAPIDEVPPLPADLDLHHPRSPADLEVVTDLTVTSYEMPVELARVLSDPATLELEAARWVVLRDGGEPVAMALSVVTGDVVGVYSVGVPPEHRRRGLGAAVSWAAIRDGRERGAEVAVLQASDMGEPVYRRMGFTTVTRYRTWVTAD